MTAESSGGALVVDALRAAGVRYVFANFGSDHPAIIEALAADRARGEDTPTVILCPHEAVALSAAHAYAAVTGEAQAVMVHTDVGTANLGGTVHNAARSRVPVLIFAGLTPYTLEGELPGGRNTFVNHLQDVADQHGLVRPYVKWGYDLRTARNAPQVIHRALQIARSAPAGPVYVTAAREVLAESAPAPRVDAAQWGPIAPVPPDDTIVDEIAAAIEAAERPVLITTSLGRDPDAVAVLADLAERAGIAVVEHNPDVVNLPRDHPLHAGDDPHPLLRDADAVLVLDADVPWVDTIGRPAPDAAVFIVGDDPLQQDLPLWYMPADRFVRADPALFARRLRDRLPPEPSAAACARAERITTAARAVRGAWVDEGAAAAASGRLSPVLVARTLAELLDDDAIVLNEAISVAPVVWRHLPRHRPGTLFGNRGTSLGWSGGGALGVKLAARDRTVVSIVGDGTYFLSEPAAAAWIAERYGLPVLTVVLDNGGWNATKRNLERLHPDGVAARSDRRWVNLAQSADFGGIAAAAGGAWSAVVDTADALAPALRDGLAHVAAGRGAVVTVRLEPISHQAPDDLPPSP